MPRINPQVELLQREVDILRKMLKERQTDPGDIPFIGCGDNSCLVSQSQGMATNGGCRCELPKVRRAMLWWKRRAAFLEETIRLMKTGE